MEFRCLGPLAAVVDGREVDLGSRKQRLLLSHLLIHLNETVSADRLVEMIWQGEPPASVRNSLHSYVSRLRRQLGPDHIESHGGGYLLRADREVVDLKRFEALVADGRRTRHNDPEAAAATLHAALDLWSGPPFADLVDDPGLHTEVARLHELRLTAIEERVAADLDRGIGGALVPELEALTAHHPLRERLWGQLMLALYRAGRQGDALATYERLRSVLTDELGIDPSSSLRSLQERVLRQDPLLQPDSNTLRGYRLVERLSDGPPWEVWRAVPPGGTRQVIIKAACREVANAPAFVRRFEARAQQIADVQHPHVLPLYDFWREPDSAYLVHPFSSGGDLRRVLIRPERTSLPDRLRIGHELLQALACAHGRGVVHGQLRASSVLLDPDGHAYLTDFAMDGLERSAPATMHQALGTAPEQRDDGLADVRSDVYAAGMVLSELLPDVHGDVQEVLGRAVAPDPSQRQHDAAVLHRQLRAAIRVAGVGPGASGETAADSDGAEVPRNPYKGLRAFKESDVDDFCGRDHFVARLLERMREDGTAVRFLAVVGPSGSGKSSVVRAGLLPALRSGALPGSKAWYMTSMQPGRRPFAELTTALRGVAVNPPDALSDQIASEGLAGTLDELLPDDGELLLVIDQFEELFTLTDREERQPFIDAVVAAVCAPATRVRVVVTIRADFYDRPLQHRELGRLMQLRTEPIAPMAPAELTRAVTAPAERVGVHVEPAVVAEMVAEVADQAAPLPLLQYALTQLFDARTDGRLSAAAYRRIGGVTGALGRRADDVFTALSDAEQEAARQLFLRLVALGRGHGEGHTRRRVPSAEIVALAPHDMPRVLTAFGDARLLSFDRDPDTREPTVEVAHEALLLAWDRLRGWIEHAREDLHTQQRLAAAADDWAAADRDPSFLATGARLEQYETWRSSPAVLPTAREAEFLDASREHRDRGLAENEERRLREQQIERRSVRRLRVLVGVLAGAAVIGGGLTVFATNQADRAARQAEEATRQAAVAAGRELAAAAVSNLDVDPERSILLALAAVDRTRAVDGSVLPEVEEALHRAVTASRIVTHVPGIGGQVAWSPAGDEFVTEGPEESGLVDIRDATTGDRLRSWRGHDIDINHVTYSPDGSLLLTTGDDGALRAWDPSSGAEISAYVTAPSQVWGASASPDNALMAAVWIEEGIVRVIDVASGAVRHEIAMPYPAAARFSPDGTRLAVNRDTGAGGLVVIDVATGDQRPFGRQTQPVYGWDWSPDGRWLAAATPDSVVHIYDAVTGDERSSFSTGTGGSRELTWSADTERLAVGGNDGTAMVWTMVDGQAREPLRLSAAGTAAGVQDVAFSPDGQRLLTGDITVTSATIWDLSIGGDAEALNIASSGDAVRAAAFTPDGRHVVVAGGGAAATLWDARTGARMRRYGPDSDSALGVATSGDGGYAGTVTASGQIRVYDTGTAEHAWTAPQTPQDGVVMVAGDMGSAPYLAAAVDDKSIIRIFNASGRQIRTLEEPGRRVTAIALHPDSRRLAVGSSPTGRQVPGRDRIAIFDLDTGERVQRLAVDRFVGLDALAFDAAGRRLAATQGEFVDIWDLARSEVVTTLAGHRGRILDSAFSPDGAQLATVGTDEVVRVWDTTTGIERLTLPGHDGVATTVAYSPDGERLMSAGVDGVVRMWVTDVDELVAIAEEELTRELTTAECRQYLHADGCPPG